MGRAGGAALAQRLVPTGPREEVLLARARLLSAALGDRITSGAPLLQVMFLLFTQTLYPILYPIPYLLPYTLAT